MRAAPRPTPCATRQNGTVGCCGSSTARSPVGTCMCAAVRARGWIDSGISSVVMTASLISDKSTKSHKYQRIARSDTPQPPPRLAAQRTASFGGICAFERISCPDYVFYVHSAPQTACICCHGGISVAGDRAHVLRLRQYYLVGKTYEEPPPCQRTFWPHIQQPLQNVSPSYPGSS